MSVNVSLSRVGLYLEVVGGALECDRGHEGSKGHKYVHQVDGDHCQKYVESY